MGSRFDQIYRSILLTKFFTHGWGEPENLRQIFKFRKILSKREECLKLVDANHSIQIVKETDNGDHYVMEAVFSSPMVDHLPGLLPQESEKAYFQMLIPKKWKTQLKPTCLHLAGTGDHGFWRRRLLMGKPLLQDAGIASIIHENPFYGARKPRDQRRSNLRNVSDLFLMGGCLVLESLAIFHWAEKQGFGPLGITGISMGGHMASLAACSWNKPIPLVPCLSWTTASGVFTQGVLSGAINWEKLKDQYFSDHVFRDELFNMIQSPEGHFRVYHEGGKHFAKEFPYSLNRVQKLQSQDDDGAGIAQSPLLNVQNAKEKNLNPFRILHSFNNRKQRKYNPNIFAGNGMDKENISDPFESLHPVAIRPISAKDKPQVVFKPYIPVRDALTWEAIQFMRGIMDECTHIANFSRPVDPSLVIIVAAEDDAYMPRDGLIPLNELWQGSELRTLNSGHISAFLFNQQVFKKAITDAFERTINKYYTNEARKHTHCEPSDALINNLQQSTHLQAAGIDFSSKHL